MTMSPATSVLLAAALLTVPPHPRSRILMGPVRRARVMPAVLAPIAVGVILTIATPPVLAVIGVGAMVMTQSRRRALRRRQDCRREGEQMIAALETVVGELRVGAHPLQAFGIAAAESSGAVGAALRTITARVGLGADIVAGLRAVADESAVPFYWERVAVCWRLASDHGLAVATLMRAAQRDIVDRQRFGSRVDASLAGPRATAAILAALPIAGILLGELIGAHPVRFLLGGGPGGWLLITGAGLIAAGVLWSDHLVNRLAT